jgi:hypothetical protein
LRGGGAEAFLADDVDLEVALVDDVVEVRDDEDLAEVVAEFFELFDQCAPALEVLASEDLVEDDETCLGAALAGE